ncbi:hypothetical protein ACP70R_029620 [Stipagrostis hirtigluma subsp. patula]
MAAPKLNPDAPAFHCRYALHSGPPPPPPPPFPLAPARPPPPSFPFATCCFVASHHGLLRFCFPAPPSSPIVCKSVLAAPHGRPPHKLMFSGGAEKLQPAAAVQVPAAVAMDDCQEPRSAVVAAAPPQVAPAPEPAPRGVRLARRKAERSRSKAYYYRPRRAAAGPPEPEPAVPRARSPSPVLTTRPQPPWMLPAPEFSPCTTTLMIRNVPNRLTGDDLIKLLDEHCARVNKAAGAVVAAYDVAYLRMDFRRLPRRCNFGYGFVNFTTAEAARGLYEALHGCRWKVPHCTKVIHVCRANIQGKEALVRHFGSRRFQCDTDELLPAVFSPPRDGAPLAAAPARVGRLLLRAAPAPRHAKKTKASATPKPS